MTGRSPRGRRSRLRHLRFTLFWGSISAWAEEPVLAASEQANSRVDLRVGGGAGVKLPVVTVLEGRSPRGRRSQASAEYSHWSKGSISAWAEEPLPVRHRAENSRVDLRVGGGAVILPYPSPSIQGRSPRGRRSQHRCGRLASLCGSISAWAEEPRHLCISPGSSNGSISAWAEEPAIDWQLPECDHRVDLRVGGGAMLQSASASRIDDRSISAWAEEPAFDLCWACFIEGRSPRGRRSPFRLRS